MRTIRQRKDELLAAIRAKASEPLTAPVQTKEQLYKEYRNILVSNGIKNEDLIFAQLTRMIELNLTKENVYSNLKFLNLCRSCLTDENISFKHAEEILSVVEFNMSEINEDDDYIGDVALVFAELAKIYYNHYVIAQQITGPLPKDVVDKFNILPIQLPV